jgi:DNA-binding transcriptional regulator GbsR (MarR family)
MAKIDPSSYLTLTETARQIGISRQSVHQAVKERRLPSITIAGRIFIPIDAVRAYAADPAHIELGHASQKAKKQKETNGK